MKILVIDIETSPNIAGVWDLWSKGPVYPHMVIEPREVICFAAKWAGEEEVFFRSKFHDGKEVMIREVWRLLNEADGVVHFNGRKFDIPRLNGEFLLAGLTPPSPSRPIDLLDTIKRKFDFEARSLDYVSQRLGLGHKVEHEGYELWRACCERNDPDAWERMKQYNIGDILLTEKLYWYLLPWIERHPNANIYGDGELKCPHCEHQNFKKEGFAYTQQGKFQRYSCLDCGTWFRDVHREQGSKVAEAV